MLTCYHQKLGFVFFTLITCLLLTISDVEAFVKEDTVFLPTRPGVILPFVVSFNEDSPTEAVAILFAGSSGNVGIVKDQPVTNGNFLVRSRKIFVQNHLATVVVDCPSDNKSGMSTAFRTGKDHATDIGMVVDEMSKKFPGIPVFLIGTSKGTISAAYLADKLEGKIKGVVLTSSVYSEIPIPPKKLSVPVLLVHNTDDGCPSSPGSSAKMTSKMYDYPLILVHGGSSAIGRAACEPFSPHGYLNKEEATIESIANWLLERPYKSDI